MKFENTVSTVTNIIDLAHRPSYNQEMLRRQAYTYQLCIDGAQLRKLRQFAGACRYVFNRALAFQKTNYEAGKKFVSYNTLTAQLPVWKKEESTQWLAETPSQPLQQALKDLDRAFQNFFAKRADFPRFKKKGQHASFRYPDAKQFKIDPNNGRVLLPKLGWLRYRNSRVLEGTPKNITVSEDNGQWFISIQTERDVEQPKHPSRSIIGLDVGIVRFATLSDGTFIEPCHALKSRTAQLARAQRSLSRKVKFSNNWKKAKKTVQTIHCKIRHVRQDYLHKTSITISKNHAIVFMEDLQVKNMSQSARGTLDAPGTNVSAKSGLNRAILDQGWAEFRRQLAYKLQWLGGQLLLLPPRNSSRTCPRCAHCEKGNRVTQSRFLCTACGYTEHADRVAAFNLVRAGHAQLACRDTSLVATMAQEPSETILRELALGDSS